MRNLDDSYFLIRRGIIDDKLSNCHKEGGNIIIDSIEDYLIRFPENSSNQIRTPEVLVSILYPKGEDKSTKIISDVDFPGSLGDYEGRFYAFVGGLGDENFIQVGFGSYTYIAYASSLEGADFSLSPGESLNFMSIIISAAKLESPQVSHFTGSWYKYKPLISLPIDVSVITENSNTDLGHTHKLIFPNIETEMSISGTGKTNSKIKLINDENSPGKNKYYGTDNSTSKGYKSLLIPLDPVKDTTSQRISGTITWLHDLTFLISVYEYYIRGEYYTSPSIEVTLAAADLTFPRVDTFIVDINSISSVITGIPAESPADENLDSHTQLLIGSVLINPGETTPVVIQENIIYDENVEWTSKIDISKPTAHINFEDASSPFSGSKQIRVSFDSLTFGGIIFSFTKEIGYENISESGLVLHIRTSRVFRATEYMSIKLLDGSRSISSTVYIKDNKYGFNSSLSTYQTITIAFSDFKSTSNLIDGIKISFVGWDTPLEGVTTIDLDLIKIQKGILTTNEFTETDPLFLKWVASHKNVTIAENSKDILSISPDQILSILLPENPGIPGEDGREIELSVNESFILWRYVGEPAWINLIALSLLKGDKGDPGSGEPVISGGGMDFTSNTVIMGTPSTITESTTNEVTAKSHTHALGDITVVKVEDGTTLVNYGYLYNWHAVTDVRNIASAGWSVPPNNEFAVLSSTLGGNEVAGGKLKYTGLLHWQTPNTGANNDSGFGAYGGGRRSGTNGDFAEFKSIGNFWSVTPSTSEAYKSYVQNDSAYYSQGLYGTNRKDGLSVRLLKTLTSLTNGQTGTYKGNDGKVYKTICIGTQEWLSENLMETKYRDGSSIPEVTDNTAWAALTTGARCSYNNDENNAGTTSSGTTDVKLGGVISTHKPVTINPSSSAYASISSTQELTINFDQAQIWLTAYDYDIVGDRNGINKIFTIPHNYYPGTPRVYLNGLRLQKNIGWDYIEASQNRIDLNYPVQSTDLLLIDYIKLN